MKCFAIDDKIRETRVRFQNQRSPIERRWQRNVHEPLHSESDRIEPNRAALITVVAAGTTIGSLPFLLFVGLLPYCSLAVVAGAVVAIQKLRGFECRATEKPSLSEWVLGGWSTVALPTSVSFVSLLWYAMLYWSGRALIYLAGAVGFELSFGPSRPAFWIVVVMFAALMLFSAVENTTKLAGALYPETAGTRSAFYSLTSKSRGVVLLGVAVAVAFVLLVTLFDTTDNWFPVLLSFILAYSSIPLTKLAKPSSTRRGRAVDILAAYLERSGYEIVQTLRTGKPDLDPLLAPVDILAENPHIRFAMEVAMPQASQQVEWNAASSIRTASSILNEELEKDELKRKVVPVLVLVGGEIAPSLRAFSEDEGVRLVHFENRSLFAELAGRKKEAAETLEAGLRYHSRGDALDVEER